MTDPRLDQLIARGARLDQEIKALQKELEQEVKAPLKEALAGRYETFLSDQWTVTVKPYRSLNKTLAEELYGFENVSELVITPRAVQEFLATKYAGKQAKLDKKLAAVYNETPALTFGMRG